MLAWFKARSAMRATAKQLYGTSVTQARHETFYAEWHVPDTLTGRFEMIVLHLFMLIERLQHEAEEGNELARTVLEAFVIDIDDHMREVGIADLKVPKHVKKAAAIAYDRFSDYGAALKKSNDQAMRNLLLEFVYGLERAQDIPQSAVATADQMTGAQAIASYLRRARVELDNHSGGQLMAGQVTFPVPTSIPQGQS